MNEQKKVKFPLYHFFGGKVNIIQNLVDSLSDTVLTNQTQISLITQSRNKDHTTKWLLHRCLGRAKRALVKPCNNPYLHIYIESHFEGKCVVTCIAFFRCDTVKKQFKSQTIYIFVTCN